MRQSAKRTFIEPRNRLWKPIAAALAYFAIIFACGFALAALRVLGVAPRIGATVAVSIEVPMIPFLQVHPLAAVRALHAES